MVGLYWCFVKNIVNSAFVKVEMKVVVVGK